MPFGEAFSSLYARGLASMLVNLSGDTFFLETEQESGAGKKFAGTIK